MGTSYLFNFYLVPKYLLSKKYGWFALYFFYLLVISLYLQMWILMFSFMFHPPRPLGKDVAHTYGQWPELGILWNILKRITRLTFCTLMEVRGPMRP